MFWSLCACFDGGKIEEARKTIAREANINFRSEADFSEVLLSFLLLVTHLGLFKSFTMVKHNASTCSSQVNW